MNVPNEAIRLTVDAVVFGYRDGQLFVALINRKYPPYADQWALPGGFVAPTETLEEAVQRELREETGIQTRFLEQLYTFGAVDRDPRQRVVSVAYMGLVRPSDFQIQASTDAQDVAWFALNKLPPLAFDHAAILQRALDRLRGKLTYEPIGLNLLDETFPFGDLERLYAAILNKPFDRRNFRKKVLSFNILVEQPQKVTPEKGRPATYYAFDKNRYETLRASGFLFDIK
ncbi:7,8-dihydro-8-oxoguanine triphosphatase [Fibrella aestuarina BUZ 2]|uniref:7,8-dihydro-8-oxoguanine triphosphatase n=1 Tax=Fibrella aestuarina BUZ 2 TaxID=1166018 RepID=I0KH33_9BACT|nr:NUDIX domain-containing protein [Fibrella aestuarina]CCH03436.1 7,8-dihydro-8-oxoguanine triphosphatase [Fibrella aestuarina BUZ 2]